MLTRSTRSAEKSPEEVARLYCISGHDANKFRVENFSLKGRGVVTTQTITKGEFMLEYKGKLITSAEGHALEKADSTGFRFFLKSGDNNLCLDASNEPSAGSSSLGRLVNHGKGKQENVRLRVISVEGKPRLCLFANRDIDEGAELLYDYGVSNLPWKTAMCHKPSEEKTLQQIHLKLKQSLCSRKPDHNSCIELLELLDTSIQMKTWEVMKNVSFLQTMKKISCYKLNKEVKERGRRIYLQLKDIHKHNQESPRTSFAVAPPTSCASFASPTQSVEAEKNQPPSIVAYQPPSSKASQPPPSEASQPPSSEASQPPSDDADMNSSGSEWLPGSDTEAASLSTRRQFVGSEELGQSLGSGSEKKRYLKPSRHCPFCEEACGEKLTRHIKAVHKHVIRVREALKLNRKEQCRAFSLFRKEGILNANKKKIMQEDEPEYERERRTSKKVDLTMCGHCKGFFSKKFFVRHKKLCKGDSTIETCNIPVSLMKTCSKTCTPEFASEILARIQSDDIGNLCKTDQIIMNIGQRLWEKEKGKADKRTEVRKSVKSDMRRLASLYLTFLEQSQIHGNAGQELNLKEGNCSDLFARRNFNILSESVRVYTTDPETKKLKPGLKMGTYYLIKKACKIVKATYLVEGLDEKAEEINKFVAVLELNQSLLFGDAAYSLNVNRQSKLRKPMELPLESDIQRLHDYTLNEVQTMLDDKLLFWDKHDFVKLRDLTGSRVTLFNARRGGEPCRLKISDWQDAENGVWVDQEKVVYVTDPLEKKLIEQMKICFQTGKGNNHLVSVIFPQDTVKAMKTLCDPEVRSSSQVHPDNPYIFASVRGSMDHMSGWHALNSVCDDAGVQCKDRLNATKNRHRVSTLYAGLELSQSDRDLFFKHMGHSEDINKNTYQTPLAIQELIKVGKNLQIFDSAGSTRDEREDTIPCISDAATRPPQASDAATHPLQASDAATHPPRASEAATHPHQAKKAKQNGKDRMYTRWGKRDTQLLVTHFSDIVKCKSSRSIPGRQQCDEFLRKSGLDFPWTAVRNKVMNERSRWCALRQKREDSLDLQ